jgi:hypothetical protein
LKLLDDDIVSQDNEMSLRIKMVTKDNENSLKSSNPKNMSMENSLNQSYYSNKSNQSGVYQKKRLSKK